jgi:hypothetical protein
VVPSPQLIVAVNWPAVANKLVSANSASVSSNDAALFRSGAVAGITAIHRARAKFVFFGGSRRIILRGQAVRRFFSLPIGGRRSSRSSVA